MNELEYDASIQIEEKLRKQDLAKFAKWLANNKIEFDGYSIWKLPVASAYGAITYLFFSTEQLIEKFLKES